MTDTHGFIHGSGIQADSLNLLADRWNLLKRLVERNDAKSLQQVWMIRLQEVALPFHVMVSHCLDQLLQGKGVTFRYDAQGHLIFFDDDAVRDFETTAMKIMTDVSDTLSRKAGASKAGEYGLLELWAATEVEDTGLCFRKIPSPASMSAPSLSVRPAAKMQERPCNAGFQFTPVWEVGRSQIFSYLCEPPSKDEPGQLKNPQQLFDLDLQAILATNEQIQKLAGQDIIIRFIIPVRFETLANDKIAGRYIEKSRSILKYWFNSVVFEITAPPDTPDRITELLKRRPLHGQPLFVRLPPSSKNVEGLAELSVQSVGLDLREDRRPEEDVMRTLEDFVLCAGKADLKTHVYGLKTISLSIAAVTAGFDFIGSDAISSSLDGMGMDRFLIKPKDIFMTYLRGMSSATGE